MAENKWVTGVISLYLYIGVITPVITGRGLPCMGMGAFDSLFGIPGKRPLGR